MKNTNKENNLIALLETSVSYKNAYNALQLWDNGRLDKAHFTSMILGSRKTKCSLHYLYLSCTHPDTRSEYLAELIEDMVCHTMNSGEIRALLIGAVENYPFMNEMAEYMNGMLETGCMEGRPEFLLAAKILAPEWVWQPSLQPEPMAEVE